MPATPPYRPNLRAFALSCIAAVALHSGPALAVQANTSAATPAAQITSSLSFADLADLADRATIVGIAEVRKATRLKPEQAGNVRQGWARLYIQAQTLSLLFGTGISESVSYLADVKLTPEGKLPKLRKARVLFFANPVPGKPEALQLVASDAQILSDSNLETRVRELLTEIVSPDAAPRVVGVREAIHVTGNLSGEGETQIFLSTQRGDPVSISVIHRPGMPADWGVSLSEIVDQSAKAPAQDTLTWYRLACFLPRELPRDAILTGTANERLRAAADYRLVMSQLGPCTRTRPQ